MGASSGRSPENQEQLAIRQVGINPLLSLGCHKTVVIWQVTGDVVC
jgi:hypothetical protein